MSNWLDGEKTWLFLKKKREYKGKEMEKRGENVLIITVPGEKNIILKSGGGQKYQLFG